VFQRLYEFQENHMKQEMMRFESDIFFPLISLWNQNANENFPMFFMRAIIATVVFLIGRQSVWTDTAHVTRSLCVPRLRDRPRHRSCCPRPRHLLALRAARGTDPTLARASTARTVCPC